MALHAEPVRRTSPLGHVVRCPLVRIILAALVLLAGVAAVQSIAIQPLRAAASLSTPASLGWLLIYLLSSVLVALLCYRGFVRVVERRPAVELSSAGAARELGAGMLLGGALFAATLAVLWLLGYLRLAGALSWQVLGAALAVNVAGAVVEEVLLRGILFRITEEATGTWIALAVSVVVFGLLHAGGAASSPAAIVVVALAGGLLPGAAYVLSRRLWLPIGIHAGWDFVQDIILGLALAGHQVPGLVRAQIAGPSVVTGGGIGPEGSLVALALCLAASTYLLVRASRHDGIVRTFRHRLHKTPAIT